MTDVVVSVSAPGRIALEPRPVPTAAEDEVVGRTLFSLVSPGTELAVAFAETAYGYPLDLGYAAVVEIEETGAATAGWRRGDVALSMGHHASRQALPARELVPLPDGLDPALAPFARLLHVPLAVLATSPAAPGARVGVAGLGLIGQLGVRAARALGFDVVAADPAPERRALLPAGIPSGPVLPERDVDLVLECSGHESSILASAAALRDGGELALAGVPWRPREDGGLHELASLVFHRYLTVRSGWEWQVPWTTDDDRPTIPRLLGRGLELLRTGAVDVDGLATTIAPRDLPEAYLALRERRAPTLSYLVDWGRGTVLP